MQRTPSLLNIKPMRYSERIYAFHGDLPSVY